MISALLVALVVRALVPAGFMPATDRPFSFQICPDGFPAALLADGASTGANEPSTSSGAAPDAGAYAAAATMPAAHAGHHHHADSGERNAAAPASHHAGTAAAVDHADGLLALTHHHHDHNTASAEHCVFAAAAGAFALAFAPTFSAPAALPGTPESPYLSAAFESRRFRLPQPRGPPALS